MNDLSFAKAEIEKAVEGVLVRLSDASVGDRGVIVQVRGAEHIIGGLGEEELQRRLLELGFVEGAQLHVLHEGLIGHDPIAVRLDDMRVALRRRDAENVIVRLEPSPGR